jgi:lysozyme family protein
VKENFRTALAHVLVSEGGWADHPRDPGGATMKGVTLRTYRRFFGQEKTREDLRNIPDPELEQIYAQGYWNKCRCDDLCPGVDLTVFDGAVNSGPGASVRWLQAAVGTGQDGVIGQITLARVVETDPIDLVHRVCDLRITFLHGLSTWPDFGRGWRRRVERLRSAAVAMAQGLAAGEPVVPSVDYRTVKRGSRGIWVKKLQQALKIHVDGFFGIETKKALEDFQRENGLEADGIAGRITYRALGLIE